MNENTVAPDPVDDGDQGDADTRVPSGQRIPWPSQEQTCEDLSELEGL